MLLDRLKSLFHRSWAMDAKTVAAWVTKQDLSPGQAHELALPADLAKLSCNGKVVAAHLPDGRTCVLLKKEIGWKDNFEGVFYCDKSLHPSEMMSRGRGEPAFICLAGYGVFEELYVRTVRDERVVDVYFDLN
jgi:hypothetical protein